jgi:hypothetical protein
MTHFCAYLQGFRDWPSAQGDPSVCYSSVNKLLEPRSGGS